MHKRARLTLALTAAFLMLSSTVCPAIFPVLAARLVELDRNIPYWTVVKTSKYVQFLLSTGGLAVVNDADRMGLLVPAGGIGGQK